MAVVLGTSSGFVTVAPTNDPAGTGVTFDGSSVVTKDTSPAGATTITEIGWYRAAGTNSANFEVALYSESAGIAATRLFVDDTNSDTAGGWVRVAVNWTISPSTAYWLGLQMDGHTGNSGVDSAASGGAGSDILASQTALNDPYGGGAVADSDGMYAIYALLASTASPNVSDSITVTDTPTVSVQDITLAINKSESITVTDTPIVLIPELLLNVSESITITDTPIVLIPVYLIDGFDSTIEEVSNLINNNSTSQEKLVIKLENISKK